MFYYPDSSKAEQRKKELGEDTFYIGYDDAYYMYESHEFLKGVRANIIDAKNVKFLSLIKADKSTSNIKLDTIRELWGLYLFNPKKEPKAVDITMIKDEYHNYYK
ncbi:MAG TPA: hypothetical protein VHB48_04550 [Chitinophagaceae bacterium]|nr:hypothetical protein [Chitinophagaceae bacterium]